MKIENLMCLKGMNVIDAQISDHNPVVYHNLLFWNVMMQAKQTARGYNNGFKISEDSKQYLQRLTKVAAIIAEIVYLNSHIQVIGLCEGPIEPMHVKHLFTELKKFSWLDRLLQNHDFHRPSYSTGNNWGLLMLSDSRYKISKLFHEDQLQSVNMLEKLANRFQAWELEGKNSKKIYFALAHLPFSGDELKNTYTELSENGKKYCYLVNMLLQTYSNNTMVFCGDYNINPALIRKNSQFDAIPIGNSILSEAKSSTKLTVTVDGILLSDSEKQRKYTRLPITDLFGKLKQEWSLAQVQLKQNKTKQINSISNFNI